MASIQGVMSENYTRINADILRLTPRAVQVRCADGVPRWIPRSCIFGPHEKDLDKKVGQLMELRVFEWLVKKDGIPISRQDRTASPRL